MSNAVDLDLLGGAQRVRTRVRGFAAWSPRADTLVLLNLVYSILIEYAAYLPLTLRQIFYRLVGAHDYEKTERAYERLGEMINRARRARMIEMDAIRDDGGSVMRADGWESAEQWLESVQASANHFKLDRSIGQPTRLVVTCEATGMAPQLARVANPFGVEVKSSGGFESTTERYAFAADVACQNRPTEVLDIGDHDASGAHRYLAYAEDIEAFVRELGGEVSFIRLAVTPAQIRQFNLPMAPPKPTDKRAFAGQTCQAEALAPDVLAEILRTAIESRIDLDVLDRVKAREKPIQRQLVRQLGGTP